VNVAVGRDYYYTGSICPVLKKAVSYLYYYIFYFIFSLWEKENLCARHSYAIGFNFKQVINLRGSYSPLGRLFPRVNYYTFWSQPWPTHKTKLPESWRNSFLWFLDFSNQFLSRTRGDVDNHLKVTINVLDQWYSTWGTRTPGGARRHVRRYIKSQQVRTTLISKW
jgi:hypothetical protein